MKPPTPEQIKKARRKAGHSQTAAAALVHRSRRIWTEWEAGRAEMDSALWELYLIKTGATPTVPGSAR